MGDQHQKQFAKVADAQSAEGYLCSVSAERQTASERLSKLLSQITKRLNLTQRMLTADCSIEDWKIYSARCEELNHCLNLVNSQLIEQMAVMNTEDMLTTEGEA